MEVAVDYFNVLYRYLNGGTEENHESHDSRHYIPQDIILVTTLTEISRLYTKRKLTLKSHRQNETNPGFINLQCCCLDFRQSGYSNRVWYCGNPSAPSTRTNFSLKHDK
jgi:hypothetical protein